MPRRYNLGKRAALKEETRRRILEATFELHSEQGTVATSMQDIADRADVALHTVYRYFPKVDDLVAGCGGLVEERMAPPGPAVLAGISDPDERVRVFVAEQFAMYQRGARMLEVAHCEKDHVAALGAALERWARDHTALAREALRPRKMTAATMRDIMALTDFFVWKAFVEHNSSTKRAAAIIAEAVLTRLRNTAGSKGGGG